jgi:hypothetical protein
VNIQTSLQALAIARSSEADEAVLAVYLHSLADLDAGCVSRACERLSKRPRVAYEAALPDVGTIRAEAAKVAREDREAIERAKLLPGKPADDEDPRFWAFFRVCDDGGWRSFRCDGMTGDYGTRDPFLRKLRCGRQQLHYGHSYAERCPCIDTNPVIAKRREAERRKKVPA